MKNLYKKILASGYSDSDSELNNYRKKIVNITVLYAIPILIIFSIANLKKGIIFLAVADLISATVLLLSFIYLNKIQDVRKSAFGVLLSFYIIFSVGLFSASIANSIFLWFMIFPSLSIFFFGIKKGLKFTYTLVLIIVLFFIYANITSLELAYDTKLLIVLILALGITSLFTVFYEGLRENYEKTILEQKQELEELNKSLEKKVYEEVEKNRQKDQQLVEQSRLAQMGEMISMIAHQWRQPLSAINSSVIGIQTKLELGKFDLNIDADREKFLKFMGKKHSSISDYVKTLSETIDDFRNFFKPDKDKEKTVLTEPIKKALKIVKTSMSSKGIEINSDFINQDELSIYQNELMQVVLNILKNSEDNFIEKKIPNPKIDIKTFKTDNSHIIEICDNGGGIPKDIIPNIFDPYFSTKDEKNGTGLGLYMSKIMIEDHHEGKLTVSNTTEGACFKIEFQQEHIDE